MQCRTWTSIRFCGHNGKNHTKPEESKVSSLYPAKAAQWHTQDCPSIQGSLLLSERSASLRWPNYMAVEYQWSKVRDWPWHHLSLVFVVWLFRVELLFPGCSATWQVQLGSAIMSMFMKLFWVLILIPVISNLAIGWERARFSWVYEAATRWAQYWAVKAKAKFTCSRQSGNSLLWTGPWYKPPSILPPQGEEAALSAFRKTLVSLYERWCPSAWFAAIMTCIGLCLHDINASTSRVMPNSNYHIYNRCVHEKLRMI